MRSDRLSSALRRYALSFVAVAAASALTFLMLKTIGPNPAIGYAYLFAIMAAAWWGGYGPGVLACALSFFLAPYLFIPQFNPARTDLNRLALTILVSLLVSRVAKTRRQAERVLRSENERLEQRVQERTAELAYSNAELEQYAYAASHDLQEPLRTIGLYVQMLRQRYRPAFGDDDAEQIMQTIETSTRRMTTLIADLLVYSRLEAGMDAFQAR